MKKDLFLTAANNLKANFWLLLSAMAALCLFMSPFFTSPMVIAAVFAAVAAAGALVAVKPAATPTGNLRIISVLLTVLLAFMGLLTFRTAMASAGVSGDLVLAVLLLGSLYALYTLSCWIVSWSVALLETYLPVQNKAEMIENLKRNWYFPISAMAFFFISATLTLGYAIGLLIAFGIAVVISARIPSMWSHTRNYSLPVRVFSAITAIGICLGCQDSFYTGWSASSKTQALEAMLPISIDIAGVISVSGAVISVFFVYFCVLIFWNNFSMTLHKSQVFSGIPIAEWVIYGLLLGVFLVYMVFSFAQTAAFYGTELSYDIIYTSDSPSLVKENVYWSLTHGENDLRQPLFAVFAAPFTSLAYLVARLTGASATVQAMLINSAQIIMLLGANLMLARMMRLDPVKRVCFMLLSSCTYMQLLFMLMMEQYIVAYFWLIFCLYLIAQWQQPARLALWGTGGTLLTGMILLPFMSRNSPFKAFKAWLMDMVNYGLEFAALLVFFCRFDVIFNLTTKIDSLRTFTGHQLTMADKVFQYTAFVSDCLIAPNAGINPNIAGDISWQLNMATSINFVGVAILVLAAVSAIWNRDKRSSLLAAGWAGFSVVMLLVLGWGTKENGLILYALYFGWAFLVLLFQLFERIQQKLNVRFLLPVITAFAAAALLAINIPAIMEMVHFAITHYPT